MEEPRSTHHDPDRGEDPAGSSPREDFVRLAAIFYAAMFAVALLWGWIAGDSIAYASPAARAAGIEPLGDIGVGLLAAGAVLAVSGLATRFTDWGQRLSDELAALIGRRSLSECLLLAFFSGIAEEALFRGALQPQVGWVAASLIFGLVHFAPKRGLLPWTGFAVLAGFGLGALFDATGNLVAPIVAHVTVNAVNLWLLAKRAW